MRTQKMRFFLTTCLLALSTVGYAQTSAGSSAGQTSASTAKKKATAKSTASSTTAKSDAATPASEPTAIFDTTMGKLTCSLFPKEAPKTVANFVGLANGTKEWTDRYSGKKKTGV